jgi:hypothetical protein
VSAEEQLAVYLDHLACGPEQRHLGQLHNMSPQTARMCIKRVSHALIRHFHGYISLPSPAEVSAWADFNRETYLMEGCVAAMDGTHVALARVPAAERPEYLNHKEGAAAMVAHAVVSPLYVLTSHCEAVPVSSACGPAAFTFVLAHMCL